jgi:hypothetical protein
VSDWGDPIEEKFAEVLAYLDSPLAVPTCEHIAARPDEWVGHLCLHHPEAGVLCRHCAVTHVDGLHPESRPCDWCSLGSEAVAITQELTVHDLTLASPGNRTAVLIPRATLSVVGIVICSTCAG